MDAKVVQLYHEKVARHLKNIAGDKYSDERLVEHRKLLNQLYIKVGEQISSLSSPSKAELNNLKLLNEFISTNLNYLEDSTLNLIPYETIYCLEQALSDWASTKYVLVNTHQYNTYFFDPKLLGEFWYDYISSVFGIDFPLRLIQISIPKQDVPDYLLNVILYHELGHFVDNLHRITDGLIDQHYSALGKEAKREKKNHYAEYFADLFAAQYVGNTLNHTLDYIAHEDPSSFTHPATNDRLTLVKKFLSGNHDDIIDKLKEATEQTTGLKLEKRCSPISDDAFKNYIPTVTENVSELHSLFETGWNLWLNRPEPFDKVEADRLYMVINNLLEKSISNYMVKSKWEASAPSV